MVDLVFKDPRDYLKFEHELRRARRPSYSMRAFARDLDISPSSLNDFLKGRIGMSEDRIESISARLRWTESRKTHFKDLIIVQHHKDPAVKQSAQMRVRSRLKDGSFGLSVEAFKAVSEWYHLVILEMCDLKDAMDAGRIARELCLPPATAARAIKRLASLGLLKKTQAGWKPVEGTNHFGDESPSEAIVTFHSQILDLAQKALHEKPMTEREAHSLVFSMDRADISKMNAEIRGALLNLVNKYAQTPHRNHIHAISLQSFAIWNDGEA